LNKNIKYLLILFIYGTSIAQESIVDSLKLELKKSKHDSSKCRILSALAEVAPDGEWHKYNHDLRIIAKENSESPNTELRLFYLKFYARSLSNAGIYFMEHSRDGEAIKCYEESAEIQKRTSDLGGLAITNNNMASIHNSRGNIKLAMTYYSENLKIFESLNDKKNVATTLNNLGVLFYNQGDKMKAKDYYEKSLRLKEELLDVAGISDAYNNLAFIFYSDRDFPTALKYYNKALNIELDLKNEIEAASVLSNIGMVYSTIKEYNRATEYYEKSMRIQQKANDLKGLVSSYIGLGYVFLQTKDYNRSEAYSLKGLEIARTLGYPERIRNISRTLVDLYNIKKEPGKALEMFELFIQMRDSIFNNETKKAGFRAQLRYQYEKKAAADSIVAGQEKKLNATKLQHEKVQRNALGGGLALTVLFGIYIFNRFRLERKQKRVIEEQKTIVEDQKNIVEEKQKEILSSIRYAERIQQSLLPNEKHITFTLNRLKVK